MYCAKHSTLYNYERHKKRMGGSIENLVKGMNK